MNAMESIQANEQTCLSAETELRAIADELRRRERKYQDSIAELVDRRRELFQTLDGVGNVM